MSNLIKTIHHELTSEAGQQQLAAALPKHITPEKFTRVAYTALMQNPGIAKCDRRSIFNALMRAAQDGLLPDGRDGAIVEFKGQAQWMPMIGGIRRMVRNSGEIATWDVQAVYANDEFDYMLGDEPRIHHKPYLGAEGRGELIAVYSIATLKSGEKSREVMSREEIDKVRSVSRSGGKGPWGQWYEEMAKKTVARRHSKVLPMSTDLDDLMRREDYLYDLEGQAEKPAAKPATQSLAGKLDLITGGKAAAAPEPEIEDAGQADDDGRPEPEAAADVDPETGEVDESDDDDMHDIPRGDGDEPSPEEMAEAAQQAEEGDDEVSDADLRRAEMRGRSARQKGMLRKACPPEYRSNQQLADAWYEGWEQEGAA